MFQSRCKRRDAVNNQTCCTDSLHRGTGPNSSTEVSCLQEEAEAPSQESDSTFHPLLYCGNILLIIMTSSRLSSWRPGTPWTKRSSGFDGHTLGYNRALEREPVVKRGSRSHERAAKRTRRREDHEATHANAAGGGTGGGTELREPPSTRSLAFLQPET